MHIVLFRSSPRVVMMNHIKDNTIVIAPESQREKYEKFESNGFHVNNVNFISDYVLPVIVKFIRDIEKNNRIESITTLSEEDMDWVGLLNDYFTCAGSSYVCNTLFKDKYYMRSFLQGQVEQPIFRLIEEEADIDKFWKIYKKDHAIIKPRMGAGSQGVIKISRGK